MKAIVLLHCVLLIAGVVAASPYMCGALIEDPATRKAYRFDLTPLYHDNQYSDELYYMGTTGDLTYFNICGDTTTTCSPASPVCRRSGLWSTQGFGKLHSQTISRIEEQGIAVGRGVTIHYTSGEYCPNSVNGTSSTINIICGRDEGVTNVVLKSDGCSLFATIVSKAGCGVEEPLSGSSSLSESSSSIPEGFCLSLTLIQVFIIAICAFIFY